jgi:hypothetical protein
VAGRSAAPRRARRLGPRGAVPAVRRGVALDGARLVRGGRAGRAA